MSKGKLILDRYRLLGEAGAGGYGTVMVAWDPRIQRKVAIKTILLTETDALRAGLPGADARADFAPNDSVDSETVHALAHIPGLDEARTAAMLSDSHIVTVYDVEVRGQAAYLIMEYIEGITLSKLMHDYPEDVTLDVVACVVDSVAAALKKAHSRHVLHLDIKPDNILINREGQVKVTDFGLATLVDASGAGTTGGGTIGYMPLEQMRRQDLDARSDEWSLASVTYEMLTGENPFLAHDLDQAEAAIEDAELVLPSLCWNELDEGIDDVLFYALDPDKENRYETVRDFQVEADKFLGDAAEGARQLKYVVSDALGAALESLEDADEIDELDDEEGVLDYDASDNRDNRSERRQRPRKERGPRVPMSARLTPGVQMALSRVLGAVASGFVGFLAISNMPFFTGWLAGLSGAEDMTPTIVLGILTVVVAVLGAAWPHVGALISFCALALAFVMGSNPIVGIVLLAATIAWWYFVGRTGIAEPNVATSLPIVGAIGFNSFLPLAAGTCLKPVNALATTGFAAVWAVALGACGTGNLLGWNAFAYWDIAHADAQIRVLHMLASPTTWCIVASWLLAVVIEAACNTKQSKPLAVFGVIVSAVILVAGALGAAWFDSNMTTINPSMELIVPIAVSAVVMTCVVVWIKPKA